MSGAPMGEGAHIKDYFSIMWVLLFCLRLPPIGLSVKYFNQRACHNGRESNR